jgi:Hemerythrin HHE cation binding domain
VSIVDTIVAAVTPPESEDARREARAKAHSAASPGDWLSMVLEHHERIESAFAAVRAANSANAQIAAQKKLAIILTGHANAEESVIYPALAGSNEKGHATTAYTEQAATKIQMGLLEKLAPMTTDYLDKLEHIRGAVAHHMYEEEGNWFIDLKEKAPAADQVLITRRYEEEFTRYVGANVGVSDTRLQAAH